MYSIDQLRQGVLRMVTDYDGSKLKGARGGWNSTKYIIQMLDSIKIPKKSHALDIGVFDGRTSMCFLHYFSLVTGIDIVLRPLAKKLADESNRYTLICGDSNNCASKFDNRSFDFIYIDGSHDYKIVEADIRLYKLKVRKGGYLAGHDFTPEWPGVMRAIRENIDLAKLVRFKDSSWLVQL